MFQVVPLTNARRALIFKNSKKKNYKRIINFIVRVYVEGNCNYLQCFDQNLIFDVERRQNLAGDRSFNEISYDKERDFFKSMTFISTVAYSNK